jgi:hypothetical protein
VRSMRAPRANASGFWLVVLILAPLPDGAKRDSPRIGVIKRAGN